MGKIYTALGLMSGTSMDGVDASIIQTDGKSKYKAILDKYFEYPKNIYKNLTTIRDKIKNSNDLKKYQKQIKSVEKEITTFHAESVNKILKKTKENVDFIGFHGQTIFHNAEEKISKQLGDGKLLSKLTNKKVVYDFRQHDLKNGGQGAPLTPIFHKLLIKKLNFKSATFLNIGGIVNETSFFDDGSFKAHDLGPGMCLIDKWIRKNSKKRYDNKGNIAKSGKIDQKIFDNAVRNWKFITNTASKKSLDIKEMELFFSKESSLKGLTLEDGAATLTAFTVETLTEKLPIVSRNESRNHRYILCGGGRKNVFLVKSINKLIDGLELIDDYGIDGDFIESQAFAYLSIRSFLKLPISFPETTGCKKASSGGVMVKNF
jgi:anhydro-N-acetylmuramic acid kinase